MSKKAATERTKPAPHLSIKSDKTGIHARFVKYANRVVICVLSLNRKETPNYNWSEWNIYGEEKEGKAKCHPGGPDRKNPEVIIPADVFDDKVGMDLAYLRASKIYDTIVKSYEKDIKEHEEELAKGRAALTEVKNAIQMFELEYAKLRDNGLLICEEK